MNNLMRRHFMGGKNVISGFDVDYLNLYNTYDTKPSNEVAVFQNQIFVDLKQFGLYNKLDFLYCFVNNTKNNAFLNWKNPNISAIENGTVDFNPYVFPNNFQDTSEQYSAGIRMINPTDYLDLSYNPFNDSVAYDLDNASIGFIGYNNGQNLPVNTIQQLDGNSVLTLRQTAGDSRFEINGDAVANFDGVADQTKINAITGIVKNSSPNQEKEVIINGISVNQANGTIPPIPTTVVSISDSPFLLGYYTALTNRPRSLYFGYGGGYLTPTEANTLRVILKDYMLNMNYTLVA